MYTLKICFSYTMQNIDSDIKNKPKTFCKFFVKKEMALLHSDIRAVTLFLHGVMNCRVNILNSFIKANMHEES